MRDFYEAKLREMGDVLKEKEGEREHLLEELKRSKDGESPNKELQARLVEKERAIAVLRKKQRELRDLTSVSAQNHTEISRLTREVQSMKGKKVDLQKQLGQVRRDHATEKRQLQKTAMQKDREINKWKKSSTQNEVHAQKANQVAKARLSELGQLRSKYKDAEKKFRMASLKRGVMQKAGLDPVLVGRRNKDQHSPASKAAARTSANTVDLDALKAHFDQKIASVVRKEAIVDKLAHEWEEHLDLTTRKQEMEESGDADPDSIESLSVQIRFKEERIRQFANRLGKHAPSSEAKLNTPAETDPFLFDQEFLNLCSREFGCALNIAVTSVAHVALSLSHTLQDLHLMHPRIQRLRSCSVW
jgi:DNA repair exonuclease SbcCD ATPase subunit